MNEGIANLKKAVSLTTWLPPASAPPSPAEVTPASTQASSAEVTPASTQPSSAQVTGDKAVSGAQHAEAAVRSATDLVREARKNLSEAGGLKYKEIQRQAVKTVAQ